MIWSLSVLCFALVFKRVDTGPVRKMGRMEPSAAPQDEVNVLMFGVIQFSESLNYAYETTEAKIAKITKALKSHEQTLLQLGAQTEKAAEVERQIKDVIRLLQDQMAKQEAQTSMTRDWLAHIEQEEEQLRAKVKRLDSYLNTALLTSIRELQERVKEHSSALQGLELLTQYQRERIELQNEHLLKLQEKLSQSVN
ncbi:uncharacterized protein angptl8 [Eucyclogobius newberryi]|uniref:uncharacterized protein angptl8 n=1 Tax=Eucyclogobius newberryi TaxID=166745 RepID=UPI003B5C42C3